MASPDQAAPAASAQRNILNVVFKDTATLYASYIRFIRDGAIFVSTTKDYPLGHELFIMLVLPDEPTKRVPISGKVIWVTPPRTFGNRPQGVGVQFQGGQVNALRGRIERQIERELIMGHPTYTL